MIVLLCGLSNSRDKELLKMKVMIGPQNHKAKNKQTNFNSLLCFPEVKMDLEALTWKRQ